MITAYDVYRDLKNTGMMGKRPMSTSEKRNVTPALTSFIFEKGQESPNGKSLLLAVQIVEGVAASLKEGSERRKGVEKALEALREESKKR